MTRLETFKTMTIMAVAAILVVGLFVQTTNTLATTKTSVHKILTNK